MEEIGMDVEAFAKMQREAEQFRRDVAEAYMNSPGNGSPEWTEWCRQMDEWRAAEAAAKTNPEAS